MNTQPESGQDAYTRDTMQKIAHAVNEELPDKWGFFVMAFPFSDGAGRMNYVSNAARNDILRLMVEFIGKNRPETHNVHADAALKQAVPLLLYFKTDQERAEFTKAVQGIKPDAMALEL